LYSARAFSAAALTYGKKKKKKTGKGKHYISFFKTCCDIGKTGKWERDEPPQRVAPLLYPITNISWILLCWLKAGLVSVGKG
jgi:hypothetical protein